MPQPPTCHHVLASGALCQATPLRNRDYCRFHLQQIGRRMKAARTRARHQAPMLNLPLLEDPYSVQVALMQLADAIAHREIDPQYARLLTTVLRLAMQNLNRQRAWENAARFQLAASEAAPTAWDTFEQEHDLPAGLDLSLDPEVAFPPTEEPTAAPLNPGVGSRGKDLSRLTQILGDPEDSTPPRVTADDVEIVDVLEREGNEAMMQVIAEQQRNRRRRERRTRRLYYEEVARNRNIRFAAQKLAAQTLREDQPKTGAASQPSSPLKVSEEVDQVEARFTRRPPQSEGYAQRQKVSESES